MKKTRIVWTDDDWERVTAWAYHRLQESGKLPLSGRFNYVGLFREAQQTLNQSKQRPWQVVQAKDREKLLAGINAILVHRPIDKQTPSANPLSNAIVAEPEHVKQPPTTPKTEAPSQGVFAFENLGRMLDSYLANKIASSIDQILPEILKQLIPEQVSKAVSYAMVSFNQDMTAIPGSLASTMLEDMVAVLDEVKQLKTMVISKLGTFSGGPMVAQAARAAQPFQTLDIDPRPLIVVTGAHSQQAVDIKRDYEKRLRLQVYTDVNPGADCLTTAKAIYVFERHTTRNLADKLRGRVGHSKVHLIAGGLGAIRRSLDTHVAETASANHNRLQRFLGQ